ncbi:MAG: hypothetical protein WDO15_30430 [Bacteroidota bacterium]
MIHRALETGDWLMWTYVVVFFASSMLTVLYCYRLYVKVFFGPHATPYADLAPVPPVMQWPVSILAILSLGIFFWQLKGPDWHALHPRENIIAAISIGWTLLSLALGWFLFTNRKSQSQILDFLSTLTIIPYSSPRHFVYRHLLRSSTKRLSTGSSIISYTEASFSRRLPGTSTGMLLMGRYGS